MTAQEMHLRIDLSFQNINSNVYNDFHPEEIDIYLNRATDYIIRETIASYYEGSLDFDGIQTLIVTTELPIISSGGDINRENESYASLPNNFNYFISGYVKYGNEKTRQTKKVNAVEYEEYATYDYNKQLFYAIPLLVKDNKVFVLEDSDDDYEDLESVLVTYSKIPQKINLLVGKNSDLPDSKHQDIVDRSVELMKADLGISNDRQRATA